LFHDFRRLLFWCNNPHVYSFRVNTVSNEVYLLRWVEFTPRSAVMLTTFRNPDPNQEAVHSVTAPGSFSGQVAPLRPTRLFALAQQISNPQGFWVNACIGEPLPYRSFRGMA
jgi:hypothetical protein